MGYNWRKFQKHAARSKVYRGFKVREQVWSHTIRRRPDFFGVHLADPSIRIVGDAKWTNTALKKHIDQVARYKSYPFCARTGVVHYPRAVVISDEVRRYARDRDIHIDILNVKKKAKIRNPGRRLWRWTAITSYWMLRLIFGRLLWPAVASVALVALAVWGLMPLLAG